LLVGPNPSNFTPRRREAVRRRIHVDPLVIALAAFAFAACVGDSDSVPEISAAEISAEVPQLDAVHELMFPLWHDAFPSEDVETIRELVPQFEPMLAAVDSVPLPGILRDKQVRWDEGKAVMMAAFDSLKAAAEANDTDRILSYTEAFHLGYEQLVRVVRPLVPELEAFHQDLYKLYHYYNPANDQARIREAIAAMADKLEPLSGVTLPERLAEWQAEFDARTAALGEQVNALAEAVETGDREAVRAAVESLHTAYAALEAIFE